MRDRWRYAARTCRWSRCSEKRQVAPLPRYRRLRCASTCTRARTRKRRTAWPRESWPIISSKGGACCAMASSCSRTGAHCSLMAGRSPLPHRHGARGWRSPQGRHDEDDARWLMRGRRGTTGHLCAGCSGESSPASPQCSNWLSGICWPAGPRTASRHGGATRGSTIIARLPEGLGWPDLNIVHGPGVSARIHRIPASRNARRRMRWNSRSRVRAGST
jgi:hypothetical protein